MANSNPTEAYFFGYGSLVNRNTHVYADARPARLESWTRVWRQTDLRPVAYLTVVPDETSQIDGLMAAVPASGWAELDLRERAYDRVAATHQVRHDLCAKPQVVVYSIPDGKHGQPDQTCPVLLSYIDVVAQGYLQVFGENGARAFFKTTQGWDSPVRDDRAAPIYPRHQLLSDYERGLVDEMLIEVGARVLSKNETEIF
ncbi:MAG: gamma-glutamylcyclotransferase [Pseudomonadota bacterium]